MPPTNEPAADPVDPEVAACLARTRAAVLDVLVAVGALIAASGLLLRGHDVPAGARPSRTIHDGLFLGLIAVAVCSYGLRRMGPRRSSGDGGRARRSARFFWSHVGSATVAATGVLLGFAYGWFVDPRLEGVIAFWVVPLALGLLALPRRGELEDLGPPPPNPEAPST